MKKTTLGVKLFTAALFILSFALIFVLISEVSVFAADSVLPVTLIKGSYCPRTVGQPCIVSSNSSNFISEPIPVTFGHDYSFSFYANASNFILHIVGIDSSNIVTEVFAIQPGESGNFDYIWSPTVESTVSFRFRGNASSFDTLDLTSVIESNPISEYDYFVDIDGSSFTYSSAAESITLDLIITANDYKISVDGSEEDYRISDTVLNNDKQKFAGLSVNGVVEQVDYGIGRHTITLDSSNPTLFLGTVWKYPLYVDPNGGTWNGSSSTSVFWELPNTDTDEINYPVRPGYTFSGWTFTGDGEFNNAGDPPHIYEHGTAPGYLIANWEAVPTYTHTITIDGSSYPFTAENAAPPVTIQVTSTGFTMSYGETTKTWTYSGSDLFVGIKHSSGNICYVGSSFSLLGSSGSDLTSVLTPLTEAPSQEIFVTLVKLYDSTGNSLLESFIASSYAASPSATLAIGEKHLVFDSSSLDSPITWNYTGDGTILGIALSANATSPSYTPGQTMSFGGVPNQGSVTSIYLLTDSFSTPDPDPEPDLVVLSSGQYEAKKLVMTGEYNDLSAWPSDLGSVALNFKSAGSSYSQMYYQYDIYQGNCIYYGNTIAYSYGLFGDPYWTTQAFAQIYFASDQEVPQAFYDWFTTNFYRVGDDQVDPVFTSTVNVYNSAGTQLLHTVSFTGTVAPSASLYVSENGCTISYSGESSSWTASGDFFGFNLSPSKSFAYYQSGHTYSLPGGSTSDIVVDLYVVDTESSSEVQDIFSGMANFLVSPLMVFFNLEFIPGISFGKISLFAFVLGLVFWFLKAAK